MKIQFGARLPYLFQRTAAKPRFGATFVNFPKVLKREDGYVLGDKRKDALWDAREEVARRLSERMNMGKSKEVLHNPETDGSVFIRLVPVFERPTLGAKQVHHGVNTPKETYRFNVAVAKAHLGDDGKLVTINESVDHGTPFTLGEVYPTANYTLTGQNDSGGSWEASLEKGEKDAKAVVRTRVSELTGIVRLAERQLETVDGSGKDLQALLAAVETAHVQGREGGEVTHGNAGNVNETGSGEGPESGEPRIIKKERLFTPLTSEALQGRTLEHPHDSASSAPLIYKPEDDPRSPQYKGKKKKE